MIQAYRYFLYSAVEKILAKSPDLVNMPKEDGFTALHLAALNDHCEVATLLCGQV